ncbi:MAG: hypothetical protein IKH65_00245 [Clostridia bacterium]|nr:hypothetical protein [Clostridia bacterium]
MKKEKFVRSDGALTLAGAVLIVAISFAAAIALDLVGDMLEKKQEQDKNKTE